MTDNAGLVEQVYILVGQESESEGILLIANYNVAAMTMEYENLICLFRSS